MESLKETLNSNSNSKFKALNYSNSNSYLNKEENKVSTKDVFTSITDLVKPDDSYMPFYVARYKQLGYRRFMELVAKARAGGKSPERLFFWMLKNNEIVV